MIPYLILGLGLALIWVSSHHHHRRCRLNRELRAAILRFIEKEDFLITRDQLNEEITLVLDAITAEAVEITAAIQALKDALEAANVPIDFTTEFTRLESAVANISGLVTPEDVVV